MSGLRTEDVRPFIDVAFDRMLAKAVALGPDVNARPDLDGANSVFQIVTHCVGVTRWWLEHAVVGNPTQRDRAGEFTATGDVSDLEAIVAALRRDLDRRLPSALGEPMPRTTMPSGHDRSWPWTTTAIVLHVVEELSQHAGHVDITADLIRRNRSAARELGLAGAVFQEAGDADL